MTIVFIHGAGATHLVWRLQLHRFRGAVAVELPGHPNGTGRDTIESYADFVEDYVREFGIKDPVLVGHSMGGAIAMTLALRSSGLRGLALVGTGARLRVNPEILSKIVENYGEATKLIAGLSVSRTSDPIIADRIAAEILQMDPKVVYGDFMACDKFDRMEDVAGITCRTIIIVGSDDRLTPVKYSNYLHGKTSNSRLVVIPDAGHSVMLERHHAFNDALQSFADSL